MPLMYIGDLDPSGEGHCAARSAHGDVSQDADNQSWSLHTIKSESRSRTTLKYATSPRNVILVAFWKPYVAAQVGKHSDPAPRTGLKVTSGQYVETGLEIAMQTTAVADVYGVVKKDDTLIHGIRLPFVVVSVG